MTDAEITALFESPEVLGISAVACFIASLLAKPPTDELFKILAVMLTLGTASKLLLGG